MFWANFHSNSTGSACSSEQVVTAHETIERQLDEASITYKCKTKSYILSLCSRNCLVKECIGIILTPGTSWVAHDCNIELSKDVWKTKVAMKAKRLQLLLPTGPRTHQHCHSSALWQHSCCQSTRWIHQAVGKGVTSCSDSDSSVLAVPCTGTSRWDEMSWGLLCAALSHVVVVKA